MRLAVVGSPVEHSLSPVIHTAALAECGIDGSYTVIDCDAAGFPQVLRSVRTGDLDGCNVTMPHKRLAHDLVDDHSPLARRAGAVNTVTREDHRLVGHNTDVTGIIRAAESAGLPGDIPVLVLGAGGAAAAALLAFEGRRLALSARSPENAAAVAQSVGVDTDIIAFGTPVEGALVVNATPIGMKGETLPTGVLAGAAALFDMPYGATPTPASRTAWSLGRPVVVGEDMLLFQALESFRLWTGCEAPIGPVRSALRDHIDTVSS